jgi:hypothetical protein
MDREASHQALQQRPMKDQDKSDQDCQGNLRPSFPSCTQRTFRLAIFTHEGANLFLRGESANNAIARIHLSHHAFAEEDEPGQAI